ncbi:AMP-binding protein [Variovorax sp. J22R133]|uniref:class I adenylate-forming enzyme family protein n=1 Tax=Variovorax brevis TaxID=3053503 RepID=UPI002578531E|nr:AMP-binding protein [Variovorax sp. J22R133]MDM0110610.1 AMP-binding protein [Variovorax sp. J22R133]
MNLISIFDANVRKSPEKACLRFAGTTATYEQVQSRSRQAAHALAGLGVKRGDRVALMCFNTPGFVYALIGAWRLGATVVPVNHKLQAPEVRYILEHSKSRICIGDGALAPVISTLTDAATCLSTDSPIAGLQDFDALLAAAPSTPLEDELADENAVAEILYTSGTTGRPKGCVHSHRTVVLSAINAALGVSITRDEVTLMAMPIWHASPLNNWLNGTLYMGGTVVLLREYKPLDFLKAVQDERVTLYFGAPVSFVAPLQVVPNFAEFDLSSVRAWIYGGGPIGADLARKLAVAYKSETFFQVYGMTEAGPVGTTLYPEEQVAKAGSIGRSAGPAVDMRVVREDGRDASRGETGEIWLRTESAMQGYLDDPEATRKAFADGGWYKSGDIARIDEDGYLFIVDRIKDMIVTGGENVYSKEIEDVLSGHPEVADVAVIGAPHPEWGETVVAHIVAAKGCSPTGESLREYLGDKLAKYKIPRDWVFANTLPRTPTGKLQKFLLRKS